MQPMPESELATCMKYQDRIQMASLNGVSFLSVQVSQNTFLWKAPLCKSTRLSNIWCLWFTGFTEWVIHIMHQYGSIFTGKNVGKTYKEKHIMGSVTCKIHNKIKYRRKIKHRVFWAVVHDLAFDPDLIHFKPGSWANSSRKECGTCLNLPTINSGSLTVGSRSQTMDCEFGTHLFEF